MLLLKTAFKNILGGGMRTWLNVAVLSFTFVIIVWFNGITDGWVQDSRQETIAWETGDGQFWMPEYDRYDVFTLPDAHAPIPNGYREGMTKGDLTPVLVVQGTVYPGGGRMMNIQLKGIPAGQTAVKLPTQGLAGREEISALVGKRMARSAGLQEGDYVMVRWRDRWGAFDARQIRIAGVFDSKVPAIDNGQLWLDIEDLQQMTGMDGEATYLILSVGAEAPVDSAWVFKSLAYLTADLDEMLAANRIEMLVVFVILLSVALLAVFDTQTLSIFRRQKEIGTYVALGMTQKRVAALFTLEGTAYSLLAIVVGAIWGIPVLLWQAKVGMPMPDMIEETGIAIGNVIYPIYTIPAILWTILVIVFSSALISYWPARKITKQNIVLSLKGKIL
ncbi:putative ABC transport system permease protein [Parabacteroides sp. PFB2-12]|uniref:ABC transporter permease n=1 Tax=unclassified Parabacteroides TaxID=2649774 RepID=UPI0024747658|nr:MULTISPECIES: FtsX-like permease family protein [unclassified Parabacteroides]MDH6341596.1 putative ABC transport system permease protein [Parabacteroides sp. PM6-13]MDH6389981.1 putative ABC transport system permease protein [Parabacteroides sp. PFB2-12]